VQLVRHCLSLTLSGNFSIGAGTILHFIADVTAEAPCVMVVDDEPDIRELLRVLLERRGYTVRTAANGEEALAILRSPLEVGFVLLDMMMPEVDGLAVLASMAADPALRSVPVCVSTATPLLVPEGVCCLPKPIDLTKLYALLEQQARNN
jgi:CheY-like chemotaxis protein